MVSACGVWFTGAGVMLPAVTVWLGAAGFRVLRASF